ncbi:MAG: tRNA uridine-5-carboxymethylaminomethyl(34) synthesis GTPase MnmE [Bdellovibrionota bacterium]|jgi:tRNA modification GTPase
MIGNTTIAALATAPTPAGLAVLRVSGPNALSLLKRCFRSKTDPALHPRHLILGSFIDPKTGEKLDRCLAVFMKAPRTFTGEDVVEFQLHGSPLLARRLLHVLYTEGAVPAAAGEFTKRAFLNGKIDLLQAEGISDMINASCVRAQRAAKEQLAGRFSNIITDLANPLRDILAELEARIDFPEEDIEHEIIDHIRNELTTVMGSITTFLHSYTYGKQLKEGVRVLLWGCPNAGKSSILNLLLNEERAIVTPIPGTTRDLIEESGQIDGYSFIFCDSAGIQDTSDQVEEIGVKRAISRLKWADIILFIVDCSDTTGAWKRLLSILQETDLTQGTKVYAVLNKIDLPHQTIRFDDIGLISKELHLSAKTGVGFEELKETLLQSIKNPDQSEDSTFALTEERHKVCLERALAALNRTDQLLGTETPLEFICAEVRSALSALEELIGITTPDDILGRIFSKFCIGK